MARKNKNNSIAESVAKSGMSAILPYVALGGAAYLGYKYLSEKANPSNIAGGITEIITERIESVKETIKEKTGANSKDPTTPFNLLFRPEMLPESENKDIYGDNPNTDYQDSTGTAGEWADFLVKGPIGAAFNVVHQIGTAINPMPEDMKAQQRLLGSGKFTAEDIADPNSLYAKLFIKDSKPAKKDESKMTRTEEAAATKSSTKTPTGPTLTDSEVAALKSLGKKAVIGPNTTGKPRVLSRPDQFGNRYDVTDLSISRRF